MDEQQWDYSIFWKEAVNQIKEELSEQEWVMWFDNISYHSSNETAIILNVPSSFYRDQVKQRYQNLIKAKLEDISGHKLNLDFNISKTAKKEKSDEEKKNENEENHDKRKQIIENASASKVTIGSGISKNTGLNKSYNFDQYVIGENNSFAANAAYAIARNPGTAYNPCLIYGGVGLGKTHLIQAIGNAAVTTNSELKVSYVTAETFTNEFIKAIGDKKAHIFKNKYRNVDILLIDDIHFIQGKDATQEELFHTFNALYDANKQMVFTCDRPVSELKKLTDRLRNRFERGLNVDLQPPNFETRFAILKQKIENKKVAISDDIINYICKNITTNVRDLEAALLRLIAYAELVNKEITMDIAQQQLKDTFSTQKQGNISIELIQRVVADYFNMSQSDLKGKRRNKAIVLPRQVAMYIARDMTEFSTTEIGLEFGGRDHTTVMHACQRIEIHMNTNPTLEPTIRNLIRTIQEQGRMM